VIKLPQNYEMRSPWIIGSCTCDCRD